MHITIDTSLGRKLNMITTVNITGDIAINNNFRDMNLTLYPAALNNTYRGLVAICIDIASHQTLYFQIITKFYITGNFRVLSN